MARDDERYARRDDDDTRGRSMSDDDRWRRDRENWSSEREDFDRGAREYESGRYGSGSGGYSGAPNPYGRGGRSPYGESGSGDWNRYGDEHRFDDTRQGGFSSQGYGQGMGGGYGGYGGAQGGHGSTGYGSPRDLQGYGAQDYGAPGAYGWGGQRGYGQRDDDRSRNDWQRESAWEGTSHLTAGQGAYEPWRYGRSSTRDWAGETWRGESARPGQYRSSYGQGRSGAWPGYGSQFGGYGSGGVGFGATPREWSARDRESRFYGRGPRGYQRSDERIREDVNDRLTFDPDVDASEVTVEVRDGEVRLEGYVFHRDQKRRAEDLVETVPGVKDVSNHIKVRKHDHDRDRQRDLDDERDRSQWAAAGTTGSSMTGSGTPSGTYGTTTGTTGMPGSTVQGQIRTGMEVCDIEGSRLGEVKELRGGEFLLDRPMRRDLYVPLTAVQEVRGDRITLRYRESEVGDQNWESPALMGGNTGER